MESNTTESIGEIISSQLGNTTDPESSGADYQSKLSVIDSLLSISLFVAAGLFEVGGGYLIWIGVRNAVLPRVTIPIGCVVLIGYGFLPTLQPIDNFGRIFAVYGGFFIVLSYCWGVVFDKFVPDMGDYIGSAIALTGVCVAWFWPR
jgi:small multidrug resistance family-3 protein